MQTTDLLWFQFNKKQFIWQDTNWKKDQNPTIKHTSIAKNHWNSLFSMFPTSLRYHVLSQKNPLKTHSNPTLMWTKKQIEGLGRCGFGFLESCHLVVQSCLAPWQIFKKKISAVWRERRYYPPKNRTILVGNTPSNHWFAGDMLGVTGVWVMFFDIIWIIYEILYGYT